MTIYAIIVTVAVLFFYLRSEHWLWKYLDCFKDNRDLLEIVEKTQTDLAYMKEVNRKPITISLGVEQIEQIGQIVATKVKEPTSWQN